MSNSQREYSHLKDLKQSILIVDDDFSVLDAMLAMLSTERYEVRGARSGQQALRLVAEKQPSLYVLDYHLREMTGLELFDMLQERYGEQTTRAIMVSGTLPLPDELAKRAIIGIEKPCDLDQLLCLIDQLLIPDNVPLGDAERSQSVYAS